MLAPLEDLAVLGRAGIIRPSRPSAFIKAAKAAKKWDRTLAGAAAVNAARYGDDVCLVDEDGAVTFNELHRRTNALANALKQQGVGNDKAVGLLCRDHRGFVEATIAVSKCGADLLLLNTGFSGPQLGDVLEREGAVALIHDTEFDNLADHVPDGVERITDVGALIDGADDSEPDAPPTPGRQIILTSGTTGTPKGARRPPSTPMDAVVGFLDRVPLRARRTHFVVAPMFHSWGFAHMGLGLMLGCRIVMRRRFDPEKTLETLHREAADYCAMVPVMAQRIMELPEQTRAKYPCPNLTIVALGGSAIPGDLVTRWMDAMGDNAYNTYGSTEVAIVSIATPQDLRDDPHCAGKPVMRLVIKLLDPEGKEVPEGEPGRIFVGSTAAFEGYTGGGSKEMVDGLMSTGDMGRLDQQGRLIVEGRDDDMIVSGGENVFPQEVEDVIASLDGVREVAVLGVDDDEFGQRLKAFVAADGITEEDIKAEVKSSLARYKVPREVVFLDELPRTTTGKVLKRELRELQ